MTGFSLPRTPSSHSHYHSHYHSTLCLLKSYPCHPFHIQSGVFFLFWFSFFFEGSKHTLATAAANGSIVIWNLLKSSPHKIERILSEHTRAVNRITFHPSEVATLLSASQDGTMKSWVRSGLSTILFSRSHDCHF